MALADIIAKIESDAEREAARIIAVAEERAAEIRAEAGSKAERVHETALEEAHETAEREAARTVVSARLAARDEGLVQRRELVTRVLAEAGKVLVEAGDTEYASFLARRIASMARGGETLRLGSADSARAGAVVEALRMIAPGLTLELSEDAAPFERGALIEGERVRADLALETIIAERRDELELAVSSVLFGEGT